MLTLYYPDDNVAHDVAHFILENITMSFTHVDVWTESTILVYFVGTSIWVLLPHIWHRHDLLCSTWLWIRIQPDRFSQLGNFGFTYWQVAYPPWKSLLHVSISFNHWLLLLLDWSGFAPNERKRRRLGRSLRGAMHVRQQGLPADWEGCFSAPPLGQSQKVSIVFLLLLISC
jgi:hypothetical protein